MSASARYASSTALSAWLVLPDGDSVVVLGVVQERSWAGVRSAAVALRLDLPPPGARSRNSLSRGGEGWVRPTLKDGTNSVRVVVDEAGAVVATHDYDAFGNILAESTPVGAGGQPWPFEHRAFGELFDRDLGMVFLRARWMDPSDGRFVSRDPFPGFPTQIRSLHRYFYAYSNPLNVSDPSGEFGVIEGLAVIGIGAIAGVLFSATPALGGSSPTKGASLEVRAIRIAAPNATWDDARAGDAMSLAAKIWGGAPDPRVRITWPAGIEAFHDNPKIKNVTTVPWDQLPTKALRDRYNGSATLADLIQLFRGSGQPFVVFVEELYDAGLGLLSCGEGNVGGLGAVVAGAGIVPDPKTGQQACRFPDGNYVAHEFGHNFTLGHEPRGNVMNSASNGTDLTDTQKKKAVKHIVDERKWGMPL